jgi:hypothetical protein
VSIFFLFPFPFSFFFSFFLSFSFLFSLISKSYYYEMGAKKLDWSCIGGGNPSSVLLLIIENELKDIQ